MANPFEDFKNRYAGKDAIATSLSTAAVAQMEDAYEALYNSIYKDLSVARKDVNYATYAKQSQLLKQVGTELDKFKTRSGSYLMKALKNISEYATKVSIKDLELMTDGITKAHDWHYDYNRKYVEQVYKDNFGHIAAQTDKIAEAVKIQLRADTSMIMRRAAVEGWTRKQAQKELMNEISKTMPSFEFIDKAGRKWGSKNYFSMLTHTVISNTLNEVYANTLINEGHDLVKVSNSGATDACVKWEGQILSLTGATAGYVTVAEARATGEVFHPRCRHRTFAYDPDIDDVFKQIDQGGTDAEILGFDLEEFLKESPKEGALNKLAALPVDKESGKQLNPMPMVHTKTKNTMALVDDLVGKHGLSTPFEKKRIPLDKVKINYKLVDDALVKKYIENPSQIGGGMTIEAVKMSGNYVLKSGQMKALAAHLLGSKHLDVSVMDYDKAYKAAKEIEEKQTQAATEQAVKVAQAKEKLAKAKALEESLSNAKESDFERIGPQQGSNPGGLFVHKESGVKFYIKIPPGADNAIKVANEVAASKLYKLAGIDVPDLRTITMDDGSKAVISKWQEGLSRPDLTSKANRKKFQEGFGVDAWLANWDVVGLDVDNIAFKDGEAFRIDVGGSLLYRAQGGPKGKAFGDEVTELKSLLDETMNPQSAKLFKDMSNEDKIASLKRVTVISIGEIDQIMQASGMPKAEGIALGDMLIARRDYIKTQISELERQIVKASPKVGTKLRDDVHPDFLWAYEAYTAHDLDVFNKAYSEKERYYNLAEQMRRTYPNMTKEEALAYVLYTNGAYSNVNSQLRGKRAHNIDSSAAFTRILNSAIEKASAKSPTKGAAKGGWEQAKKAYYQRKIYIAPEYMLNFMDHFKGIGAETVTDSFWSMSKSRTAFTGNVEIYFKPKRGYAHVDQFSAHQGEDEVVVPPGVRIKVENIIETNVDGRATTVIYVKEI